MKESVIVDADWLATRLDDPRVRVVDVRDPWEYEGIGHLPGAVNVPFDTFRDPDSDEPGTLPGAEAFAGLLSEAGIAPEDTIVVYDDTHGVFAARFYLTAHVYGHPDVRLLDGDYSAWAREHETTSAVPDVDPTAYEADPRPPEEHPLIDVDGVERMLEGDAVVVDTREEHEFAEGHLPGAVRFDWREVVDMETRRLKPDEEIEGLLAEHGITRDRPVLLYCNTARRISHTYVVLTALGFQDVAFYEGSLTEWLAEDREVEVETGAE